jgi:DNA-binding NarL/FixJ family response regulator
MIKNGASAYLIKDCEPQQLFNTILEVVEKGNSFDSFVIDSIIKHKMESIQINSQEKISHADFDVQFSKNELEFIKLNCSELNYADIAEIMHLSQRTIEGYRDSVFKKIKVKNRQGLMLYAIRNGIFKLK